MKSDEGHTQEVVVLLPSDDKGALQDSYIPNVYFEIPSEKRGDEYNRFLTNIFKVFIRSLSEKPTNDNAAERFFFDEPDSECGIGGIYIDDLGNGGYFYHCKLFLRDDLPEFPESRKGVTMCNHIDMRSQVEPIYELAERFEKLLFIQGIEYKRFGYRIDGNGERVEMRTRF